MNLPGAEITDLGTWKHLKVVVPAELQNDALDSLKSMGARVVCCGAYTDKTMFPKLDFSRQLLEAWIPIAEDDHK